MKERLRWLLVVAILGAGVGAARADCPRMFKAIERGNWEEAVNKGEKCAKDYAKGKDMPADFLPAFQNAWLRRAAQLGTVAAFQAVQTRFPGTSIADSARYLEQELVWTQEVRLDDIESLRSFGSTYAGLPKAAVAFELEGDLAFTAASASGTDAAWREYLSRYAGHPKADLVRAKLEASAFAGAAASEGPDSLRAFLAGYPTGAHSADARWLLANRTLTMTVIGPADTLQVRPHAPDTTIPVRRVLDRGALLRLDGFTAAVQGSGPPPALRVWRGGTDTATFAGYLGWEELRDPVRDERLESVMNELFHVVSDSTGWSVVFDRPLRRFPGADSSAACAGVALVLDPPAGVAGTPLVFPVRIEESVPAILGDDRTLLYEQDKKLWLRTPNPADPPFELVRLPQGTERWQFDASGHGLFTFGSKGVARINLATGKAISLWEDLIVHSITEFRGGLLARLSRQEAGRYDWSLVMDRDGRQTTIIEFGSNWNGWEDSADVNDRWVAFSLPEAGADAPRVHVLPLDGSSGPRALSVPTDRITLAPSGSLFVWEEPSRECILHLGDIETGKDRVIWSDDSIHEGGFSGSWPDGAPGPVASISAVPGWSPAHWLIPVVNGRPQAPVQVNQLEYDLWAGGEKMGVPARPKVTVRNGRTLVGNREVFVRNVGRTPELFSQDLTTGTVVRLSNTEQIPSEKRCGSGELVRGLDYSIATTLEHVFYIAYRSGCDGTYGPTYIARIDGLGVPALIGDGSDPPVEVEANWSADRQLLLLSGGSDLVLYDPAGTRTVLAKTVSRGQWYSPPPELLIGWERIPTAVSAPAPAKAPTKRR